MPISFMASGLVPVPLLIPLSGASIDLWFSTSQYYDSGAGGLGQLVTNYLSCTRASNGYAKDSGGNWTSFSSNVLRITDLGLLIEDARTNLFLNSQAPVTQTITVANGTAYTVSVYGTASVVLSGAGTGTATQGTDVTFTASTTSLTCTVSGAGGAFQNVNVEAGSFSSSPIVTTGASASRALDSILCTSTLSTLLTGSTVSFVADMISSRMVSSINQNGAIIGDTTTGAASTEVLGFDVNATVSHVLSTHLGTGLSATVGNSLEWRTGAKAGFAQDGTGRSIVAGGGTVASDATTAVNANAYLGASFYDKIWGYVRRLTVWNSRLANGTLQGFTFP